MQCSESLNAIILLEDSLVDTTAPDKGIYTDYVHNTLTWEGESTMIEFRGAHYTVSIDSISSIPRLYYCEVW
jgi:hypothetical protein